MDATLRAYLECALWSSTDQSRDDGGDPLDDNYGIEDIHPDSIASATEDVSSFLEANAADLETWPLDASHVGHDLWLTRNGHGAGFWDRFYGDQPHARTGKRLADAARAMGGSDPYVGDDGLVHLS